MRSAYCPIHHCNDHTNQNMKEKRKRMVTHLWYPRYTSRGKNKLDAIPLITGKVRVNGFTLTPAEAIKLGVDESIIFKAEEARDRIIKTL